VRDGADRDTFGIEETIRASIDSIEGDEITEVERGSISDQRLHFRDLEVADPTIRTQPGTGNTCR
jgi:hypothetical protein